MRDKKHAMKLDPKRAKLMRGWQQLTKRARRILSPQEFALYVEYVTACYESGEDLPMSPEVAAMEQKLRADPHAAVLMKDLDRLGSEILAKQ